MVMLEVSWALGKKCNIKETAIHTIDSNLTLLNQVGGKLTVNQTPVAL
jgi:hypothetical protein